MKKINYLILLIFAMIFSKLAFADNCPKTFAFENKPDKKVWYSFIIKTPSVNIDGKDFSMQKGSGNVTCIYKNDGYVKSAPGDIFFNHWKNGGPIKATLLYDGDKKQEVVFTNSHEKDNNVILNMQNNDSKLSGDFKNASLVISDKLELEHMLTLLSHNSK